MTNPDHLELIRQGISLWNRWRKAHPEIRAELPQAHLRRAYLRRGQLSQSNLSGADLIGTDLIEANLSKANLSLANLSGADLSMANLIGADLSSANLNGANLNGADLNGANLTGATLVGADLIGADLTDAAFIATDLSRANLSMVQAFATSFAEAIFTGACIEEWAINSATRFHGVICDYIYLRSSYESFRVAFQERRPQDRRQIFAPGEFALLFQAPRQTANLVFRNGISWQALFQAIQKLQLQLGISTPSIQAIESPEDGTIVVRLAAASKQANIQSMIQQEYQAALVNLESAYHQHALPGNRFDTMHQQIEANRWQNTQLLKMVETMAAAEAMQYGLVKAE